ncbi:hypothetical protein [Streptomyces sp. IGB124]|uniref:hypothetical protein n=1 Tax=Streptomyces sp. IGB124 TaxID=1519485 RepID=UPI0006AFFE06|nr:hypothetical protein [Streptomyces sp. IGB124]KOU66513.1 hypothetical protein ADK96_13230 [Streptomyces sp. IGB124]
MAEQHMYAWTHCGPCEDCIEEDWQLVRDGELRWESNAHCPCCGQACDRGAGVPPPWVRERILAREGSVHLAVGGPDGVPIALLRRVYGLSLAEVVAARAEGYRATPVEARYLTALGGATAAGEGTGGPG